MGVVLLNLQIYLAVVVEVRLKLVKLQQLLLLVMEEMGQVYLPLLLFQLIMEHLDLLLEDGLVVVEEVVLIMMILLVLVVMVVVLMVDLIILHLEDIQELGQIVLMD